MSITTSDTVQVRVPRGAYEKLRLKAFNEHRPITRILEEIINVAI